MRQFSSIFLCFAMLLAAAIRIAGQTPTTGQIKGMVTDLSGARVPGAKITLSRSASQSRETTTDAMGSFVFSLVPPGDYKVEASAEGFGPVRLPEVVVNITSTTVVTFQLEVASTNTEFTVTSEISLLQAASATNGRVIQNATIRQLPLPTRNFQQLLTLSAGATGSLVNSAELGRGDAVFSVNGQRTTSNSIFINGIDSNFVATGSTVNLAVPATDSLQEFIVHTSLYDASEGRNTGGMVSVVTKSGSDQYHGNAYYFLRRTGLNANNYFLNRSGIERPVLDRDQFGGTFGGPVRRDHAWFFASYQGTAENNGASLLNSLATIFVPENLTDDRSTAALDVVAQQFGVPVVPGISPHPIAVALLQAKLPNGKFLIPSARSPGTCNLEQGDPCDSVPVPVSTLSTFREDQFNSNLDVQVPASNRFSVKFFYAHNLPHQGLFSLAGLQNALQLPGFGADVPVDNRLVSLSDTHVFRAHLLNETRFGYYRQRVATVPDEPFKSADFGIASPLSNVFPGLSTISLSNMFDIGSSPFADNATAGETYHASETVSWTQGRHILRFGGDFKYTKVNLLFNSYTRGQLIFTGIPALGSDPFRDFLLGVPAVSVIGSGVNQRNIRANDWSFFVADDWHVHPQLTLSLGIRYDLFRPFTDTQGRLVAFDPRLARTTTIAPGQVAITAGFVQAGNVKAPLAGIPRVQDGLVATDWNNVSPRIGFAWQPYGGDTKLLFRGGYGMYYDRPNARAIGSQLFSFPYYTLALGFGNSFTNPYVQVPQPNAFPLDITNPALFPFGGPPAVVPGGAGGFVPANGIYPNRADFRTPYVQQYNLGVQWEFAPSWMLDLGYVGSSGRKLTRLRSANQTAGPGQVFTGPFSPGLSDLAVQGLGVHLMETSANSNYDSLQMSVHKRMARGLQMLESYTWSHSIDDYSGADSGVSDVSVVPGNQVSLQNRGLSDFDRRHRSVTSFVYDLPRVYKGAAEAIALLLNDWQLAGIVTMQSGTPFSVLTNANAFTQARADFAPGFTASNATLSGAVDQRLNEYFNTAAFVSASGVGDFGDTPRNFLRGPNQRNVDFSIIKFIPLGENRKVEFRTEFFNLFNSVNFANPLNIRQSSNFGQIVRTSTGARVIQFAFKLNF
jgi:hypothetical protein